MGAIVLHHFLFTERGISVSIQVIREEEEFQKILSETSKFLLMKHSLTCPISGAAKAEYDAFSAYSSVPCVVLNVQEARSLSNKIAEDYGVKHESPQVLLFDGDNVIWNDSHGAITENSLNTAVKS
ncbi:bacillithiol system redox-active protein YtxJ [Halobacillus fulvus]|nr:bacillithiol system redox-active protein YtxJ [Halobacillus fulvus]